MRRGRSGDLLAKLRSRAFWRRPSNVWLALVVLLTAWLFLDPMLATWGDRIVRADERRFWGQLEATRFEPAALAPGAETVCERGRVLLIYRWQTCLMPITQPLPEENWHWRYAYFEPGPWWVLLAGGRTYEDYFAMHHVGEHHAKAYRDGRVMKTRSASK